MEHPTPAHYTSRATPPADVLSFARQLRDTFGPSVRLLYWHDEATGTSQGKPCHDDPACEFSAEWEER